MVKLGAVIRKKRQERKWSMDDLVERMGDVKGGDRASLSKIENEQRWPRPDTLEAVARAFGLHVYQLFAEAEGIDLPIAVANPAELRLLNSVRAMEPGVREHYLAIAAIRAARKAAGLTQTEAGRLIYASLTGWQGWEYGRRQMPAAEWDLFRRRVAAGEHVALAAVPAIP